MADRTRRGRASAGRAFYGTAAVAFGRVYAGSRTAAIYSFDKDSGDVVWSHTIGGLGLRGRGRAADTPDSPPTVYFGTYGGSSFYALDARDWR